MIAADWIDSTMANNYITLCAEPSGFVELKRDQPKPSLDVAYKAIDTKCVALADHYVPKGVTVFVADNGIAEGKVPNFVGTRLVRYPYPLHGNVFVYFKDTSKRARQFFGV